MTMIQKTVQEIVVHHKWSVTVPVLPTSPGSHRWANAQSGQGSEQAAAPQREIIRFFCNE